MGANPGRIYTKRLDEALSYNVVPFYEMVPSSRNSKTCAGIPKLKIMIQCHNSIRDIYMSGVPRLSSRSYEVCTSAMPMYMHDKNIHCCVKHHCGHG